MFYLRVPKNLSIRIITATEIAINYLYKIICILKIDSNR